ncbi:kinesin-domain-containing protein [Hymenopellis radicata]|nr:kinesin-domain-containing protein [Hymenopellis radicata]
MSDGQRIRIAARLRPRIDGEIDDDGVQVCHSSGESYVAVPNPANPAETFKFKFSSCYGQASAQEEIYKNDVEPLVDTVYSGMTVTIFAYGVTSSGKTHTMQGTKSQPGVIPRVVRSLFERKAQMNRDDIQLSVSYMEIYKDDVYDLLVTRENAPKLPVRENHAGMVFVANLSTCPLSSVQEFDTIYARATNNRSVGATKLNHASSRSHAVLTIEVTMTDGDRTITGKMNLVDLAGSENNKLTGNDPSRMAESSAINKSLSVLGQVVRDLNAGKQRIPYRNSKLTRILQDALGGSSVGLLICNIAPGTKFRKDTLNTLNFATSAKDVENKPVINERDTRPPPKPHFAALAPQVAPLKPAILPAVQALKTGKHVPRSRTSLLPKPRPSNLGVAQYQPVASGSQSRDSILTDQDRSGSLAPPGLTEKEIDERIAKAVEAEVARRLEEKEKERLEKAAMSPGSGRHKSKSPKKEAHSLPPGILTPLLKKHKDLDNELHARLKELEKKFESGKGEMALAETLSPAARKKTGRAYVALARAHSDQGDLKAALELYRRAEGYVPDNQKLKERILDIEWALENSKSYPALHSPKRGKKKKRTKKTRPVQEEEEEEEQMDVDEVADALGELTNFETGSGSKRTREEPMDVGAPAKRLRKAKKAVALDSDDEEYVPAAPTKTGVLDIPTEA